MDCVEVVLDDCVKTMTDNHRFISD